MGWVYNYSAKVVGEHMAHTAAWYDNEWGYSCRVVDLIRFIGGYMKNSYEE